MGRRDRKKRHAERATPGRDLTPASGGETDVAPLGREGTKPAHERTADEDVDGVDWDRVVAHEDFHGLIAAKRAFIVPATIFFIVYYFSLPLLVGYAPDLMTSEVVGAVNLAYLFALSQFVMAWGLAAWYLRAAGRFDGMAQAILAKLVGRKAR
jgi:uncharacterized membrane protein (DUF485 family)